MAADSSEEVSFSDVESVGSETWSAEETLEHREEECQSSVNILAASNVVAYNFLHGALVHSIDRDGFCWFRCLGHQFASAGMDNYLEWAAFGIVACVENFRNLGGFMEAGLNISRLPSQKKV